MTTWNATLYDNKHAFVFGYGREVVDLLGPQPGERILDVGCGTGHLTHAIAQRGASVVGVDSSQEMIAQAREQFPMIDYRVADARTMTFDRPFDAVFSNAALHWIHEADQVVARIAGALKPGGRFVAEFGGKGNVSAIQAGIRHALRALGIDEAQVFPIWYFPGIGDYSQLLETNGLEVLQATLFPRKIQLDDPVTGLRDWLRMFTGIAMQAIPAEQLETFYDLVESHCRVQLYRDGSWHADYRRIRVMARKPGE